MRIVVSPQILILLILLRTQRNKREYPEANNFTENSYVVTYPYRCRLTAIYTDQISDKKSKYIP